MIRVVLAGATGWAGSELARGIAKTDDISLVGAVSRQHAGGNLRDVLGESAIDCPILGSAEDALGVGCDVFVEYTKPDIAKRNVLAALSSGANVVIGTSGLTEDDYAELQTAAKAADRAVLAVGNFALTVVLLQKFAEIAARLVPQWEIIDYAHDAKVDAPSGTVRELAARLEKVRAPSVTVPVAETVGSREARGGTLSKSQVHSVRLPSFVISAEIIFGMPDQRLTIRHDSGSSARPYVDGALLAIRRVGTLKGLHRGLDVVLDM